MVFNYKQIIKTLGITFILLLVLVAVNTTKFTDSKLTDNILDENSNEAVYDGISEGMYLGKLIETPDVTLVTGTENSITYKDNFGEHIYELKYNTIRIIHSDIYAKPKLEISVSIEDNCTMMYLYLLGESYRFKSN